MFHLFPERGVAMITQYLDCAVDEEAKQDLLQVVEYWREMMPNLNKENLAKKV